MAEMRTGDARRDLLGGVDRHPGPRPAASGARCSPAASTRGATSSTGAAARRPARRRRGRPRLGVPARPARSGWCRRSTVRAFNEAWFRKAPRHRTGEIQSLAAFFHPLDGVADWNRLYGPRGLRAVPVRGPRRQAADTLVRHPGAGSRAQRLRSLPRRCSSGSGRATRRRCRSRWPAGPWPSTCPRGPALAPLLDELDRARRRGRRAGLPRQGRPAATPAGCAQMYPRLDGLPGRARRVDPAGVFRSDLARDSDCEMLSDR